MIGLTLGGAARSEAVCEGDCDGDSLVTVDELVRLVNIALATASLDSCRQLPDFLCGVFPQAEPIAQVCVIEVSNLVRYVNNALNGCPPEPTPTITATSTATDAPTDTPAVASTPTFTQTATFTCSPVPTLTPTAQPPLTPTPLPALSTSEPGDGAMNVPRTTWIRLDFAGFVAYHQLDQFALTCGGTDHPISVESLDGRTLIVNPVGELPSSTLCTLEWDGTTSMSFTTAALGDQTTVLYDRTDASRVPPFPDDFWIVPDPATETGRRVQIPVPNSSSDVVQIYSTLLEETNKLDGFSPIAHFAIEVAAAPDLSTLPLTPEQSLDPLASVGLYNITPGCNVIGTRVPFLLKVRTDRTVMGTTGHTLMIFPSTPLAAHGVYGLVITRRALSSPERPFGPSAFLRSALMPAEADERPETGRVREIVRDVLDEVNDRAPVAIGIDDVALVLRTSVRSTSSIPNDMLAVKEQVLAAPPPVFSITSVTPDPQANPNVAAIVTGEWQAPDWRMGANFVRDANGRPVVNGARPAPFTLALPTAALTGKVPLTMYQHGNPGSSEREVPSDARRYLGEAGFAVIGFTDILNRELSPGITDQVQAITAQVTYTFVNLLMNKKLPDVWSETNAEQIAFLRLMQSLGELDVLPIGAPDGNPELDLTQPFTYVGISQGSNHAPGLLPYAPEIRAAALMVGGSRLAEVLIHQQPDAFITQLGALFPNMSPTDIWTGMSMFQHIYDVQDAHNHGEFLYRNPVQIAGTMKKSSILVVEGLNDTLVPNHATESLAWQIGPIPHLLPVQRSVPFLQTTAGPIVGNIDADTTSAFFQYVPSGIPGIPPSPGCESQPEGHYCAQSAPGSRQQRVTFFQSALEGVPRIE